MQTLSDSLVASQIRSDSPLLAGYPLPSAEFYVLAMTWPAPDVQRPGCVWTHSLLLDEDIIQLEDLRFLLTHFRRPVGEASFVEYGDKLEPTLHSPTCDGPLEVTATTIWSLYDPPCPPVEIRAGAFDEGSVNHFLLDLLSQLWPQLRRNFSFAVAPRTARRIDGRLLDLQVTTAPQSSSWEQAPGDPTLRTITKPLSTRAPDWCEALVSDLTSKSGLRAFLRTAGPQTPSTRLSMWALASLWVALDPARRRTGYEVIPGLLARIYPEPDSGVTLKEALFGLGQVDVLPFPVNQPEMLAVFAGTDLDEGILPPTLALEQRGTEILTADEDGARALVFRLIDGRVGKVAKRLLTGIGAGLSDTQIEQWAAETPGVLALLASYSGDLATRPVLWASGSVSELWPKLRRPGAARARRKAMLCAMGQAHADGFIKVALKDWPDGDELLLELLASGEVEPWGRKPLIALSSPRVLAWVRDHDPSPRLAAALLEAWGPKQLAKVPAREWSALLEDGGTLSDFTLALLLAAASDPDSHLGPGCAVSAYGEVLRRTARGSELKKRALAVLAQNEGTEGSTSRELAAGMIARAFTTGGWPTIYLLDVEGSEALHEILACDSTGLIVRGLALDLSNDASASSDQRDTIFNALLASDDLDVYQSVLRLARRFIPWLGGS